ncbi:MAG: transporter small permease protein [Betaproteobacteria bacterium]|nr:transporter small permease protein [Betaproteobacteria bacterium]
MLKTFIDRTVRVFEFGVVLALAGMVIMVFGNVVLRYGFDSGITASEEVSRYLFVWLTFMGAVVAMRRHEHLGVDTLVKLLPRGGRLALAVISDLAMLYCCGLFFWGSLKLTQINLTAYAAVTKLPLAVVYSVGVVTSVMIALMLLESLYRVFTGQASDEELVMVQENEAQAQVDAQIRAEQGGGEGRA